MDMANSSVNPSELLRKERTKTIVDLTPVWSNLEYSVQAVILEEVSCALKSFHRACRSLQLFRSEVEDFKERHMNHQFAEFVDVDEEAVLLGCKFLEAQNLSCFTNRVHARSGRNIGWPRAIDYSDLDLDQFQGRVYPPFHTHAPKPEPDSVVLSFHLANIAADQPNGGYGAFLDYFQITTQAIMTCNSKRMNLQSPGKYTVIYPGGHPPNADNIRIQPNARGQGPSAGWHCQGGDSEASFFEEAFFDPEKGAERALESWLMTESQLDESSGPASNLTLPQDVLLQPRKDAVGPVPSFGHQELQNLHNKGYRALLQFRIPPGTSLIMPAGERIQFVHGGDTTIFPADHEAFAQEYMGLKLGQTELLRMSFAEDMAVFLNGGLCARVLEKGLHQFSASFRSPTFSSQNGTYDLSRPLRDPNEKRFSLRETTRLASPDPEPMAGSSNTGRVSSVFPAYTEEENQAIWPHAYQDPGPIFPQREDDSEDPDPIGNMNAFDMPDGDERPDPVDTSGGNAEEELAGGFNSDDDCDGDLEEELAEEPAEETQEASAEEFDAWEPSDSDGSFVYDSDSYNDSDPNDDPGPYDDSESNDDSGPYDDLDDEDYKSSRAGRRTRAKTTRPGRKRKASSTRATRQSKRRKS
ncbi:hypothetical protein GGS26DRAFT_594552 [Hypomontagnella submonticulosa]|nr:hypothetical protein GGS26DRAFT_594552 [Hypomontagnella submonticulosa]